MKGSNDRYDSLAILLCKKTKKNQFGQLWDKCDLCAGPCYFNASDMEVNDTMF